MDHVYLYVGNTGGEEMILQTAKIPQNRISYVMCGCNTSYKTRLIAQSGRNNPSIIGCECGGRETLADIASKLLRGEKA